MFCPREEVRESKTIFLSGRFDREKGVLEASAGFARFSKSIRREPGDRRTTGLERIRKTPYVSRGSAGGPADCEPYPGVCSFRVHSPDKELPG